MTQHPDAALLARLTDELNDLPVPYEVAEELLRQCLAALSSRVEGLEEGWIRSARQEGIDLAAKVIENCRAESEALADLCRARKDPSGAAIELRAEAALYCALQAIRREYPSNDTRSMGR